MASHLDRSSSSTGQVFAAVGWLDAHFEMARPEYEAMTCAAGFQPGWRVLDAGCGGGSYLPWLAELVGPTGALAAIDLDGKNVAAVRQRIVEWGLSCPVTADVGSVLALPHADDSFDGLWSSAVTQYLSDEELLSALTEFRRVVRPGGLVAVKDIDGTLMRAPARIPGLIQHLREGRARAGSVQARGAIRGLELRAWFGRAGSVDVRLETTLVERWAPYGPAERQYLAALLKSFASMTDQADLPQDERNEWARQRAALETELSDPDHYYREGHVLVVGRIPT